MLRVCPVEHSNNASQSYLSVDTRAKQVTVFDPSAVGYPTTAHRRNMAPAPPKTFSFDAIFGQDAMLSEMNSTCLVEIIQSVVNGADGCLFCYGHARLGKFDSFKKLSIY